MTQTLLQTEMLKDPSQRKVDSALRYLKRVGLIGEELRAFQNHLWKEKISWVETALECRKAKLKTRIDLWIYVTEGRRPHDSEDIFIDYRLVQKELQENQCQ